MDEKGNVWLPDAVSTIAPRVDSLFHFVNWVSAIIFIGVVAAMAYFVYKYRRRSPDEMPPQKEESKAMEIAWIVVPTLLVLVTFNWGFKTYVDMAVSPPEAYQIRVLGRQWSWTFEYPNGASSNELRVPAGQPVKLIMSSADVIHSFFVPAFRVKQDVLPNRYSSLWFEATQPGEYPIYCTEYCGTEHSGMLAKVIVQRPDDFQKWLKEGGSMDNLPLPQLGEALYQQQACASCHSTDGSARVGPSFKGLYGQQRQFADGSSAVADDNYIRQSILQPQAHIVQGFAPVMPPSYSTLNERQIAGLIEFIKQQK